MDALPASLDSDFMRNPSPSCARLRGQLLPLGAVLLGWNLLAGLWALAATRHSPVLLGTALLAYGFGLRHAVDADHITAIDNVTRKLMQEGKKPAAVGLYFSLGHSTIVAALTALVVLSASTVRHHLVGLGSVGGMLGTGLSAVFLFAIAAVNLMILMGTWRRFHAARSDPQPLNPALAPVGGGLLTCVWRRLFALVGHSWQMYGVGLLFGLGFDTATEIGLLALSATGASKGLSPWTIMVFPALFSAGMALVDTADSTLMVGAYGWAFEKPIRKLYYNLTITSLSVLAAMVVGGIEALGLIGRYLRPSGVFWHGLDTLDGHFGELGYGIVGLFLVGWLLSLVIYKLKRFETA